MRLICREVGSPIAGVRLAAVGRLVDAVAPRRALAVVRLAGADPDEIGIALRDRDVADRHQPLVLELGLERGAVVDGLPHAAVRRADVEDRRVGLVDRQVRDAPRHRGRPERPEMQRFERATRDHCPANRARLLAPIARSATGRRPPASRPHQDPPRGTDSCLRPPPRIAWGDYRGVRRSRVRRFDRFEGSKVRRCEVRGCSTVRFAVRGSTVQAAKRRTQTCRTSRAVEPTALRQSVDAPRAARRTDVLARRSRCTPRTSRLPRRATRPAYSPLRVEHVEIDVEVRHAARVQQPLLDRVRLDALQRFHAGVLRAAAAAHLLDDQDTTTG